MNPFLTIPVSLPGDPAQGNDDKEVKGKILPSHVIAYHEGYAWGCCIYLSTGQAFLSRLTVPEFEELMRKYWLQVAKDRTTSILTGLPGNTKSN